MTTQFTPLTAEVGSNNESPQMKNCITPLKDWIQHTDCSVLGTLSMHTKYVDDKSQIKLLKWYSDNDPNKQVSMVNTDKKMHIEGMVGDEFGIIKRERG